MGRGDTVRVWLTCIATFLASRAALADGDFHRETIAAAGRKAWVDAYNSTPQLGAGRRPLQTVELSTLVYPYRHYPRYAVEVVHETILGYELQGYDVVVVSDGKTMPKWRRTHVSLYEQCDAFFSATTNETTPQEPSERDTAAPQPTGTRVMPRTPLKVRGNARARKPS